MLVGVGGRAGGGMLVGVGGRAGGGVPLYLKSYGLLHLW